MEKDVHFDQCVVKGGTLVYLNTFIMGRHHAYWRNADEFDVDRCDAFLWHSSLPALVTAALPGLTYADGLRKAKLKNLTFRCNGKKISYQSSLLVRSKGTLQVLSILVAEPTIVWGALWFSCDENHYRVHFEAVLCGFAGRLGSQSMGSGKRCGSHIALRK